MRRKKYKTERIDVTSGFFLAFLLIISLSFAQSITSATYKIQKESIDSGGGNFSSADYFLEVSTEPIGGNASSANYAVCVGLNCCPADVVARYINSTLYENTNTADVSFALWHSDVCMGTTNITVECASSCNPCSQSCSSSSTTYHTLTLTDFLIGRNTVTIANTNISNPIYCKVTDDTFQLERCFSAPTNLSVSVEAGGPYAGASGIVIVIAGNVTYDDGTAVANVNVTVDLFRANNLRDKLSTVIVNSSSNGKYFATFNNLDIGRYWVNVTAKYNSLRANNTDIFDVVNLHANCQIKTIALRGRTLDSTTGLKIPSGTASVTILETGDKINDVAITDGAWSADMVTCVIQDRIYTVMAKVVDNKGKISWSRLQFRAP